MERRREHRLCRFVLWSGAVLALAFSLAIPTAASADPAGGTGFTLGSSQRPSGFAFSTPRTTVGLRGGWTFNRADSDIFPFFEQQLTINRSDFGAFTFAVDFGWKVAERVDVLLGFEYSYTSTQSEFRDYVDQDGIPITQETRLAQMPLTASLKLYLTPRGRQVGQYAWVPASLLPYVGGGGGFTYYRLEQLGDFVDFRDLTIFTDHFRSSGWTPSAHVFAGVDIKLNPGLGLVLEGRYQWASATLKDSFVGFQPIDLNGTRVMAGVAWKF